MKRRHAKALIRLSAKFDGGRSGCYLEVSVPDFVPGRYLISGKNAILIDADNWLFRHPVADKSMSILLGRPICLRDEDTTCNFPRELDDE